MSYDLHIVRVPESPENQISADEWMSCITSDPEIQRKESDDSPAGSVIATVAGTEDWESLRWSGGSISASYPQKKMVSKMFDIAERLGAILMTDDGIVLKRDKDGRIQAEEP